MRPPPGYFYNAGNGLALCTIGFKCRVGSTRDLIGSKQGTGRWRQPKPFRRLCEMPFQPWKEVLCPGEVGFERGFVVGMRQGVGKALKKDEYVRFFPHRQAREGVFGVFGHEGGY